jgi:hypothetical protein
LGAEQHAKVKAWLPCRQLHHDPSNLPEISLRAPTAL